MVNFTKLSIKIAGSARAFVRGAKLAADHIGKLGAEEAEGVSRVFCKSHSGTESKSSDRKILEAGMNASRGRKQQDKTEQQKLDAAVDAVQSEVGRAEVGKRYGIQGHESMTADAVYGHHTKRLEKGPSLIDKVYGNDVHKIAAGGMVTAGVLGALSSSRGQQTNAQLYGQAPRPGM